MLNFDEICRQLNSHNWVPQKERMGILIIDMQEYFRSMSLLILKNIKEVVAAAREIPIPIFFTQHGHVSNRDDDTGMLGEWWSDLIFQGTPEAQLLPELDVRSEDTIVAKDRYNAFYRTELEEQLKEKNIKDLIIAGVMTNLCCETTARDAFVRDFRVFFLADGTSTVSEDFQYATLKNLAYGFATILTCKTLLSGL